MRRGTPLVAAALTTLAAAQPASQPAGARFVAPGDPRPWPALSTWPNAHGALGVFTTGEPVMPQGHPFFAPLGRNGRACITCHQPADAMSLSLPTIRERWQATQGRDPLFAMVDGANCPHLPPGQEASHSLLLEHGLFRIARPWPPQDALGRVRQPEFSLEVVRDPTGCNLHARHGIRGTEASVSVFRRPRPAANLKFVTAVGFPFDPKAGQPLLRDPKTGRMVSESLMADSRVLTLEQQAQDALRTHMQTQGVTGDELVAAMVAFENRVFAAQISDRWGGALDAAGASGGPQALAAAREGVLQNAQRNPIWKEFMPWDGAGAAAGAAHEEQRRFRESVARGARLFTQRMFLVKDTGGINTIFGNPVINSCATCHTMAHSGIDVAPGRVDLGTVNLPHADPAPHLPLFRLVCRADVRPHPFLGREILTHDPGYALTTGRCEDIGKITTQAMRGLAARAPYFANGSAKDLRALVDFYNRRWNIRFSAQEIDDLVNLLSVL